MDDEAYRRLEDQYLTEKASRWYKEQYPKEAAFRAFCARVKAEFVDKLTPAQEETIEYVCDAPPLPTLDQFLAQQQLFGFSHFSFGHACYSYKWKKKQDFPRIWRRVCGDWGLIELGSFAHTLENSPDPYQPPPGKYKPDQDLPEVKEAIRTQLWGLRPKGPQQVPLSSIKKRTI